MDNTEQLKKKLSIQKLLTVLNAVGLYCVLITFLLGKVTVQTEYASLVAGLVGALSTVFIGSMGFWFNSSFGSKAKDK